jgi:hypothetical protein
MCAPLRRTAETHVNLTQAPNTPIAPPLETVTLQRSSPDSKALAESRALRTPNDAELTGRQSIRAYRRA